MCDAKQCNKYYTASHLMENKRQTSRRTQGERRTPGVMGWKSLSKWLVRRLKISGSREIWSIHTDLVTEFLLLEVC